MKKKLITQMANEWKDNVWLVISLTIVCIVIWAIGMIVYAQCKGLFTPRGFDPEDVYTINVNFLNQSNPSFHDGLKEANIPDLVTLLERLQQNQHVEVAALNTNATPYNYNFTGNMVQPIEPLDSVLFFGNVRQMTPEGVKVLGIESVTGSTPDQLEEMLERGEILLSTNQMYEWEERNPLDLKGRKVMFSGDSAQIYRVGDIIRQVRRTDYELHQSGTIVLPIGRAGITGNGQHVMLKVKPGHGKLFEEEFRKDPSLRELRNVYLNNLTSLMETRKLAQNNIDVSLRFLYVIVGFILVTIFLGLLGTFHFRIQQRIKEIALRMVCGAEKKDIFRRILAEGMLLLLLAAILAAAIGWPIGAPYLSNINETWRSAIVIELISVSMVALFIILGVLSPALRAMKIEPAQAMRDN